MERDADQQRDRNNGTKTAEGATDKKSKGEEGAKGVAGTTEVSKGTYEKAKDDATKDIHG